ncbi:MAG: hypothetical protein AB7O73_03695 [Bacteroidia bacterium]
MDNKNSYLVHIFLPEFFGQDLWSKLSEQRQVVNALKEAHVILNYSMDMERKNLWVFVQCDNIKSAEDIVASFPIFPYITYKIHELAYMDATPVGLPELILN